MSGRKAFAIAGVLVVCMAGIAIPAGAETDVLDRPALQSGRAAASIIQAVARAGSRLVAVGERGIIVFSDDNGAHWRQAAVPVSVTLTNLRFVSERVGWAVGHSGVVLKTTDGGETWVKQLDGARAAEIALAGAKAFAEDHPGEVKGQRLVADAEQKVADGPDKPFLDLFFRNEQEGLVVGAYGLILATADGGRTWQSWQDRIDNRKSLHLYAVDAAGADLLIAGEQGTLYHSSDGGRSFATVKTPYEGSYFGVRHVGEAVLLFGLRGIAYRSTDGVSGWQRANTGDADSLTGSAVLAGDTLLLVDLSGNLLLSRDRGKSFRIGAHAPMPLTGAALAADGSLIVSGMGGVMRLAGQTLDQGSVK